MLRHILIVVLVVLTATACGALTSSPTPTPLPPPTPLSASVSALDSNSLIVLIEGTLDKPGHVFVEYWSARTGRFRSKPFSSTGTGYTAYAVRLRANSEYSYQVFGTNLEGGLSEGPGGTFVTGALPQVLREAKFDVLSGTSTYNLIYMEFRQVGFMGLAAFDTAGQVVWYFTAPEEEQPYVMAQKPNGNIVYLAGHKGGTTGMGLVEIDPLGVEVDRLVDECAPFGPIHHEVHLLSDERVMYLSRRVLRPGYGDSPKPQEGDTIGIWDQKTGERKV